MSEAEIIKCKEDFGHFAKYLKISNPYRGVIPLELHPYQARYIKTCEENRFVLATKFRQGGFTTITQAYALWRAMFQQDQHIMTVSRTDREALSNSSIVGRMIDNLPEWLQPTFKRRNGHHMTFAETNSTLYFHNAEAGRGRQLDLLIIDEAAFISNMTQHWEALYPTISVGGHVIVVSTPNGTNNWFYETVKAAKESKNAFHLFNSSYLEHPDYANEEWQAEVRKNLGEKGWAQEICCQFFETKPQRLAKDILDEFIETLTEAQANKLVAVLKQIIS